MDKTQLVQNCNDEKKTTSFFLLLSAAALVGAYMFKPKSDTMTYFKWGTIILVGGFVAYMMFFARTGQSWLNILGKDCAKDADDQMSKIKGYGQKE